ncbi:hypothetical protein NPIL_373741 [Nephila pilipes]|uniref:Uncharacterized protein n=1 Tax=Nephila pilipes TaxID=299642 RepID=A0A8X6NZV1_NEPPI|nr:hypothetical protein NPIL_373741 [Nephila pilipes]
MKPYKDRSKTLQVDRPSVPHVIDGVIHLGACCLIRIILEAYKPMGSMFNFNEHSQKSLDDLRSDKQNFFSSPLKDQLVTKKIGESEEERKKRGRQRKLSCFVMRRIEHKAMVHSSAPSKRSPALRGPCFQQGDPRTINLSSIGCEDTFNDWLFGKAHVIS